jgi:paraquat-inducible protein B
MWLTTMNDIPKAATANIKPTKAISAIWLIPVVALLIGAWMVYDHISNQGVLINIEFNTAEGLEINKTQIKIKNVVIGKVTDIKLNDDSEKISVSARINNKQSSLLLENSQFWVVKPRIGNQGVSGLDTLLSGAYIEFSPGKKGLEQNQFIGLESPPVTPVGTPGLHITLDNKGDKSFQVGDPILFRGITTGKIEHTFFNADERIVYYNVFIEAPYDKLITSNTRFWQINGVEVDLSADGIRIETGTLQTLLSGGISFDIPAGQPIGEPVTERQYFTIHPDKDAINENDYNHSIKYMLLFSDSIRGLKPGAPVEFRGVKVGQVLRTDMAYQDLGNLLDENTLIPIMIAIEPARLGLADEQVSVEQTRKNLEQWLQDGLQAELVTGNLLTGSKIINLQYAQASSLALQMFNSHRVIPTVASNIDQILLKANQVMDKINKLPLNEIATNTNEAVIETTKSLKILQRSATKIDEIMSAPDSQQLINTLNTTLSNINSIAENYTQGSQGQKALQENMDLLKQVLNQLQPLLLQLNQQPNSLIFSGQKQDDIEPKGAKR